MVTATESTNDTLLNSEVLSEDVLQPLLYCIDSLSFFGNNRTKEVVLLRELTFEKGTCFPSEAKLHAAVEQSRVNLSNTQLFVEVDAIYAPGLINHIHFELRERWYIIPQPVFELADRNFNEWWYLHERDLSRITYGFRIKDYNFRGRNEELSLILEGGYERSLEAKYLIPGMGSARKWGLEFSASTKNRKEVSYFTQKNKLQYLSSNSALKSNHLGHVAVTYRPGIHLQHRLEGFFRNSRIDETVTALNPDFYSVNEELNQNTYAGLNYQVDFDKRDNRGYPLSGYRLKGEVMTKWLFHNNLPVWRFAPESAFYQPLGRSFYLSAGLRGAIKNPVELPYFYKETLGFKQVFVRGYEDYVMNGNAYILGKVELKRKLFGFRLNLENMVPIRQFQIIPIDVYLKVHTDAAQIWDPYNTELADNSLNNSWLTGFGTGIDIVSAYDILLRLEYSFSRHSFNGFFIHTSLGI